MPWNHAFAASNASDDALAHLGGPLIRPPYENVFTKNNGSANDDFLRFFIGENAPRRAACHAAFNKNDNFFG